MSERTQEIIERHLSRAWKKGLISRADESRYPILLNTVGFARALDQHSHTRDEAFRWLWDYAFGMGYYHARLYGKTAKQRHPTVYALSFAIAKEVVTGRESRDPNRRSFERTPIAGYDYPHPPRTAVELAADRKKREEFQFYLDEREQRLQRSAAGGSQPPRRGRPPRRGSP